MISTALGPQIMLMISTWCANYVDDFHLVCKLCWWFALGVQITADPRVRLESKLREAGLHNNEYARQILAQVKPPQAPRKDMASTLKFNDNPGPPWVMTTILINLFVVLLLSSL
jgi:hypothetical protein